MARTRRASKLAIPPLPLELIADIIDFTVELLREEELLLESHVPLSNRFLLSAALVNRAWRPLAVKALLKTGLVTPGSAFDFLAQARANGLDKSIESIRFGAGDRNKSLELLFEADDTIDLLVKSLPGVRNIELVENGMWYATPLPPGHSINRLLIMIPDPFRWDFLTKFVNCPPKYLSITQTTRGRGPTTDSPISEDDFDAMDNMIANLHHIPNLSIKVATSRDANLLFSIIAKLGLPTDDDAEPIPILKTCHFECTTFAGYKRIIHFIDDYIDDRGAPGPEYPHLTHLASHLFIAHHLTLPGTQASLTSIEILPDPLDSPDPAILEEAEAGLLLLELIEEHPVLAKLMVPACWASDAVRECCEAMGVELAVAE